MVRYQYVQVIWSWNEEEGIGGVIHPLTWFVSKLFLLGFCCCTKINISLYFCVVCKIYQALKNNKKQVLRSWKVGKGKGGVILGCHRHAITERVCRYIIDMRKACRCRHKKYFTAYFDMLFQSNSTRKYLRNNKIISNFSRNTTIVAFLHLLYYGRNVHCTSGFVVYTGSFFVLWILMNPSF